MAWNFQRAVPESVRYWLRIFRAAFDNWLAGDAFVYAAALAFFTVFSIAPVMIVAVFVGEVFLGEQAAEGRMIEQLGEIMGEEAAETVETAMAEWYSGQGGLLATLLGIGVMVVGATTVFAYLQRSLDSIWGVVPKPYAAGLVAALRTRGLALGIVLAIGVILLLSLALQVAVQAALTYTPGWLPVPEVAAMLLELAITFAVITVLFAALFRIMPHVMLHWSEVWVGAAVTAVLFLLGRQLMAVYLTQAAPASAYGAAASLVILLMWVNYSSLIVLFGAAFTRAHLEARGQRVRPAASAVYVHRELVERPPRGLE